MTPPDADSGGTDHAVRRHPDASYDRAAAATPTSARERAVVSAQLGRPARGDNAVVHRCTFGLPTVVRVGPRLEDGTPFPTTFWLTCPVLRSRIGTIESQGRIGTWNERLERDPDLASAHAAATRRFVALRDRIGGPLPGDPAVDGGPERVKCLHAHAAHHLATGDNPVGAATIDEATPVACPGPCVSDDDVAAHLHAGAHRP